jgi:hypothetical protein
MERVRRRIRDRKVLRVVHAFLDAGIMVEGTARLVILVSGSKEEAEAAKDALATFLKQELRMELSMDKTLITKVGEGFEFLGYRVVQTRARSDLCSSAD